MTPARVNNVVAIVTYIIPELGAATSRKAPWVWWEKEHQWCEQRFAQATVAVAPLDVLVRDDYVDRLRLPGE